MSRSQAATVAPLPVTTVAPAAAGSTAGRRWVGAGVATAAAGLLAVAAVLTPAAGGLGTHEQLNLPTCGWIIMMDLPCPTCGMTTAFAHAADGNLVAAVRTQPMGAVLAVATAMACLLGLYVACTGSRVGTPLARLVGRRLLLSVSALVVVAWAWKIVTYRGWL